MASNGYLSEDFFLEDGEEAPFALETDAELERDGLDSSTEDQDMASLLAAYKKSKFSSNSNKRPSTSRKLVGEGSKKRLLFENKENRSESRKASCMSETSSREPRPVNDVRRKVYKELDCGQESNSSCGSNLTAALDNISNVLNKVVKRLDKQDIQLRALEEKICLSSSSSSSETRKSIQVSSVIRVRKY